MIEIKDIFFGISNIFFALLVSYYLMTCFQWFSYKIKRVIFHFTRPLWHVFFFIVPIMLYYTTGNLFFIYFYFAFVPSLFLWNKKLDKKLVFTNRVKRFFVILCLALIIQNLFYILNNGNFSKDIIFPIFISFVFSHFFEKMNAIYYKKKALDKIQSNKNLKIILITASYGKTSIKNFLFEILKDDFNCHKTPRSVNTLVGLIKDINENITNQTQIYIAEAGARLKGDIYEISTYLNPDVVVVGEIGKQHIEYFKSIENIRNTKLEALQSNNLKKAFLHSSTLKNDEKNIEIYNKNIKDIKSDLDGISFVLDDNSFSSSLIGKFNVENLCACIKVTKFFGLDSDKIQNKIKNLKNVEHRLEKINANGKVIIDDSFNGNFTGMSSSYELVSTYSGRKILITPGIMESSKDENEKLSRIINDIFDVVIISSPLNAQALLKFLSKPQIVILKDKNKMQETLIEHTKIGDLILFSNDAPSFM
ncbi:UDP-N-acetylmuramoylalanyl-D-glutamyl-2, 6-diaminopimelate--D-alanyl-D-alanine ligase [Campylobacter pinnipediorum subsp. caledonicus]|uniref:Mur ligase family protein n=1 Tax=Campylobacter pinnipediorum TaxID=1965231 RepID=UPI000995D65B|nr:UDP-N-acetylmuramoyl-tripeptide--D-alanyl-D-alanine ligase [Campylobacter pinnipediorum]OPA72404.1 UDP-N-acetylmuramoylalanyl-D-glutamyl-2, 6-diaminopimelate--D-alanyl-D-alanine ligase [Campylobacter pinnipediorum subsp. caledonicus]